jgi:hypothetical protein
VVGAAHTTGPDVAGAPSGRPVSLPVCGTMPPRVAEEVTIATFSPATNAPRQLVDTPMRIVRPALMMVTHSQTPWTVENGGTRNGAEIDPIGVD